MCIKDGLRIIAITAGVGLAVYGASEIVKSTVVLKNTADDYNESVGRLEESKRQYKRAVAAAKKKKEKVIVVKNND